MGRKGRRRHSHHTLSPNGTSPNGKVPVTDAKAQGVFRVILTLDLSACPVTICLASVMDEKPLPVFETVQITDKTAKYFRDIVRGFLQRLADDTSTILHEYDAGSKLDAHEVEHLDIAKYSHIQQQIAALSSLADLGFFTRWKTFIDGLRFYVIILQPNDGDPIYFYRWYTQAQAIGRSFFGMLLHQEQYDVLTDDLLLFDRHIDCFSRGDHIYILNKDKFQKMFRFFEVMQQRADETLTIISAAVPILNFDRFAEDCKKHPVKLAKLNHIASKPYLNDITLADIQKVIAKHPHLASAISHENGHDVLSYNPSDQWTILHLLDDDYLESVMTGQNYEANSKRPLN